MLRKALTNTCRDEMGRTDGVFSNLQGVSQLLAATGCHLEFDLEKLLST